MNKKLSLIAWGFCTLLLAGHDIAFAGDCKVADYGALPVDMQGGRATTLVKINGQDTRFILDTGAWFNIMSLANAEAFKLRRERAPLSYQSSTGAEISIDITHVQDFGILGISMHNIEFMVGGPDRGMGVIGANLLDSMDLDIDLAQGKLHLMKQSGCGERPLAYWAQDGNYQVADLLHSFNSYDLRSYVRVDINGKPAKAMLDSGAETSFLSRRAAERLGIDLASPEVKANFPSNGDMPKNFSKTWTVPIDSFSVGGETIQHSRIQVIDRENSDDTDLLLGSDFFLAHHLFIANSQEKIYFTYNGGRVFALSKTQHLPPESAEAVADAVAAVNDAQAPKSAEDIALRGEAHISRGEYAAAIADLDNAIRMAPDKASYYFVRARLNLAINRPDAGKADLDKAIALDPKYVEALLLRARLRLRNMDEAGAAADIAAARQLAPAGSAESRTVASYYIEVGQAAEAIPLLDDWIRLHGDDSKLGTALNTRCWARGLANLKLDDALADCKAAIKRDGPLPTYLDSLGLVQLRLKNYPAAVEAYQQALAKNPKAPSSLYGLGLAKIRSGQQEAGNADQEAAKALAPQAEAWFTRYGV